jgi:hypothetical protein
MRLQDFARTGQGKLAEMVWMDAAEYAAAEILPGTAMRREKGKGMLVSRAIAAVGLCVHCLIFEEGARNKCHRRRNLQPDKSLSDDMADILGQPPSTIE